MANSAGRPCPRCTSAQSLSPAQLRGVPVLICRSCRGVLMTRADLEAIVTLVGRHGAGAVRSGAAADYFTRLRGAPQFVGNSTRLVCPECRYDMHEVRAHDLLIDFCLNCQALWFDEGELQQTVRRARERGEVDLIPQDIDGNDTASLICYMLEALGD